MTDTAPYIDASVPPSGAGCVECDESGSWWVHLRRCAQCGHIGCCDDSINKHATAHATATGHMVIQSYEPGEEWFWDYATDDYVDGPRLAAPDSHPANQGTPGPRDRLPEDWRDILAAQEGLV